MQRWRFPVAVVVTILAAIACGRLLSVSNQPRDYASKEVQSNRREKIDALIKLGFIHKVEKPSSRSPEVAYIYILPPFHELVYDKKLTTIIYCFAWAHAVPQNKDGQINLEESGRSMILKDARTNKTIGSFSDTFGLSLK